MQDMGTETSEGFPSELRDKLSNFDESLSEVEDLFRSLQDKPISELQDKVLYGHSNIAQLSGSTYDDFVGVVFYYVV